MKKYGAKLVRRVTAEESKAEPVGGAVKGGDDKVDLAIPSESALSLFYQAFSLLKETINPDSFRATEHTGQFYDRIIERCSIAVKILDASKTFDDAMELVARQVTSLRKALELTRDGLNIDVINYSEVRDEDLVAIMQDDSNSETSAGEGDQQINSFIIDVIVNRFASTCLQRLSLYGLCIRYVKASFNTTSDVAINHMKELNSCADLDRFQSDYPGGLKELYRKILIQGMDTFQPNQTTELLRFLAQEYDAKVERKIARYKYSLKLTWEACCSLNPGLGLASSDYADLEQFTNNLFRIFYEERKAYPETFEHNQAITLYLTHHLRSFNPSPSPLSTPSLSPSPPPSPLFFRVGTVGKERPSSRQPLQ
jgi:hypothetical protein